MKFKKTNYIPIKLREEEIEKQQVIEKSVVEEEIQAEPHVPEGLWVKCSKCGEMLYKEDVVSQKYVCYKCGNYFRVKTKNRIRMLADKGSFEEWDRGIENKNPLGFDHYLEKVEALRKKTKLDEAVTTGKARIRGKEAVICVCDSRFMMGSMGRIVGEKIVLAVEKATLMRLPVIICCCSGGARMQEGMVSLMQMAKTSQALKRHSDAGLLYISLLTDPTTGGVTASFAMLGDIILAEPGALVGFAGPRVIEQTIGQKLPEGFQRAEFLLEHGLIDGIVERKELRRTLHKLICMHEAPESPLEIEDRRKEVKSREKKKTAAWDKVQLARRSDRPTSLDYIQTIFTDFYELHGDRAFRDDGAVIGGIAYLDGMPVTVIGVQKGRTTRENITRNFGMPSPEGYRKALRLMQQAEKFGRPIVTFVDTPGAFCGLEAEERGQGEAIARNLMEMSAFTVPILSIVIGEGGSGGALGLAVANEVWMMENAMYSILSPEGFASILWKDSKLAEKAAEVMKITAFDLKELGIIERIIAEPSPACERNLEEISEDMKYQMKKFFKKYETMGKDEIAKERYERFRKM